VLDVVEAADDIADCRLGSAGDEAGLREACRGAVEVLERRTGLRFGSTRRPLLLSVRSGAPVSMPGMLETVLNSAARRQ
jgi:pyruvate, orthophosphate dikinase